MIDFSKLGDERRKREEAKRNNRHAITVVQGDLVKIGVRERVETIVNAANGHGVMGAGVAKAIKMAAGNTVEYDARSYIRATYVHRPGDMYMTGAGVLAKHGIRHVLHAVTMTHWNDILSGNSGTVEECGRSLLKCFEQISESPIHDLSIAVPALGVGRGALPKKEIALEMVKQAAKFPYIRIVFVDRDAEMVEWWNKAIRLNRI
jgi:O-acetyl-ADP-ribose deacetylase (regulator of RNase III)